MTCPPEIAEILLGILKDGFLRIRAAGWDGDAKTCAAIADPLHNLLALLQNYSVDLLRYYWDAERPSLLSQTLHKSLFEAQWEKLSPIVESQRKPALAK